MAIIISFAPDQLVNISNISTSIDKLWCSCRQTLAVLLAQAYGDCSDCTTAEMVRLADQCAAETMPPQQPFERFEEQEKYLSLG